jgi:hypothetical protein
MGEEGILIRRGVFLHGFHCFLVEENFILIVNVLILWHDT